MAGVLALWLCAPGVWAENATTPGELQVDQPTIICLGFRWHIGGDDNYNCGVAVKYRQKGSQEWKQALDMHRVYDKGLEGNQKAGGNFLAGSIFGTCLASPAREVKGDRARV